MDLKKFRALLPDFFLPLSQELSLMGFVPTLVGGVVRDFHLTGAMGKDWDVELTHPTVAFNQDLWKDLGRRLARLGKMTYLPYDIIRLEVKGFQVEFSPPRVETFLPNWEEQGHKNFTVSFDFKLPFEKAVLRRDFTMNAMGIRFEKELTFLDPLEGIRHLSENVLHPCGPDFDKDPVRFLRAHRFAEKFSLSFSETLTHTLGAMKALKFSPAYLWTEMQKSGRPANLLLRLSKATEAHPEIRLPVKLTSEKAREISALTAGLKHEEWIIALEWVGLNPEDWQKYFSLGSESCRRLVRWAQVSRDFQTILPETFHGEFDQVRVLADFTRLFDWYFTTKQILQKNPDLPLLKMIEEFLPHWIHLYKFEPVKDVRHIDPPLRAMYQVWNLCQRL